MDQPFSGRGLLANAVVSGLLSFLRRREVNAVIAADPHLAWSDPHPGRLIHCCNQENLERLKMFMNNIHVPIAWPEIRYRRVGNRYSARNLYEAAYNAYFKKGVLLVIPLFRWSPRDAQHILSRDICHTSWTDAADLILEIAGPETLTLLQEPENAYGCLMSATEQMTRWFVAHGVDPNKAVSRMFGGQLVMEHHISFAQKDRVALLLSLGAKPIPRMIELAQEKGEQAEYDDPETSYCYEFYDIKKMLIAAMGK